MMQRGGGQRKGRRGGGSTAAGAASSSARRTHRGRRVGAMLLSSSSSSFASKGDSFRKTIDGHMRSTLTFDNNQSVLASQNIDYGQPIACISHPYNDSGSGVWSAYSSRAVFHPQIAGGGTYTRIPLPLELAEDDRIYVNPKQYHGILRRRQLRAKLEAQNRLVKTRKPYLHESRHLHAMKRARGSGGRFLNTKQLQQQQQSRTASTKTATDGANSSGSTHLRLGGGTLGDRALLPFKAIASQDNIRRVADSAFTVTSTVHKDDAFFQHHGHHLSFSGHFGQTGVQGSGGGVHNGTQQRVPAMR